MKKTIFFSIGLLFVITATNSLARNSEPQREAELPGLEIEGGANGMFANPGVAAMGKAIKDSGVTGKAVETVVREAIKVGTGIPGKIVSGVLKSDTAQAPGSSSSSGGSSGGSHHSGGVSGGGSGGSHHSGGMSSGSSSGGAGGSSSHENWYRMMEAIDNETQ
ncbi:MAG: hypothetical protein ACL93V_00785 [Candidatus Electrothrix sp. YB6]